MAVATVPVEKLKLRADLSIVRQVQNGEVSFIVKDPVSRKYFRFREIEHAVLSRLNGERSSQEVLNEVLCKLPDCGLALKDVEAFGRSLKKLDLLEKSAAEKNLMLLEKVRDQRQQKLKRSGNPLSDVLFMHFHLFDPDAFFAKVLPYVSFMWSRPVVLFSLAMFAFAGYLNGRGFDEFAAGLAGLYGFVGYQASDYVLIWLMSIVTILFHEFGHGLTCKRFGGEVHDLGLMVVFFNPAMYCNVSDAYTFENRRHKIYVTAAGGYVELWIWSIATIVWSMTIRGSDLHTLAFMVMVVSGVSTLAFNFNPLIKLDGYYALVDVLGIANLRDNAIKWVKTWLQRHLFRLDVPTVEVDPRTQRIYAIYGTLAVVYMVFMAVVMIVMMKGLFLGKMHLLGVPFFLIMIYTMYGAMLMRFAGFLQGVWTRKRETLMARKKLAWLGLPLLLALGMGLFAKMPTVIHQEFKLESAARAAVRPVVAGRVASVLVRTGDRVEKGQIVAMLANPELEAKVEAQRAQLSEQDFSMAKARYAGNVTEIMTLEAQALAQGERLQQSRADRDKLALRAPIEGVVVTPRLQDMVGGDMAPGNMLLEVVEDRKMEAILMLAEHDVGEAEAGQDVELAFRAHGLLPIRGTIRAIAPVAQPKDEGPPSLESATYQVRVSLPTATPGLKLGMTGNAKIYGKKRPLWEHGLIWAGKTFNPDFW